MAKTIETNEARQAGWGRPVLVVLVAALLLAAAAWAGAELYGIMIEPDQTQIIRPG